MKHLLSPEDKQTSLNERADKPFNEQETFNLFNYVHSFQDFPQEGSTFFDISPLFADPSAWQHTIGHLGDLIGSWNPEILVGIDSRGLLIASALALKLNLGFIMLRKVGNLPGPCEYRCYELEDGSGCMSIQHNTISSGQRAVLVDDIMATGRTLAAAGELVERLGGSIVGATVILELEEFCGRKHINTPLRSLTILSQSQTNLSD